MIFLDHEGTPGGGQLSARRLLPRLTAIDPHAVFITPGPVAGDLTRDGLPVDILFPSSRGYRTWKAALYAAALARWLRTFPPEVPVVALSTASAQVLALLPRLGRKRFLRLSEDMERYSGRSLKSWIYFRWVFRRFNGYISNSEWTASTIPAELSQVPVYMAYPLSGIGVESPRLRPVLTSEHVRLACFSRPVEWKGLDLAIHAVDHLHRQGYDVSLTIYGGGWYDDGSHMKHLKSLASRSAASVRLAGHIDDVLREMRSVDVVILPSRLPEPYGQVTAQSLASGCLTVVSDHGGSLELVRNGSTGLTFPSNDSTGLASVLEGALKDREASRSIAAAGQKAAAQLTDEALAADFERVLLQLRNGLSPTSGPGINA